MPGSCPTSWNVQPTTCISTGVWFTVSHTPSTTSMGTPTGKRVTCNRCNYQISASILIGYCSREYVIKGAYPKVTVTNKTLFLPWYFGDESVQRPLPFMTLRCCLLLICKKITWYSVHVAKQNDIFVSIFNCT